MSHVYKDRHLKMKYAINARNGMALHIFRFRERDEAERVRNELLKQGYEELLP